MKKLLFIMWLIAGILTFISGEVDMFRYGLCWAMLMMELIDGVIEGR